MDRYTDYTQKTVVKQKTPQGYVVVNTVKWRNWLICFLIAVIVGMGAYIAYLHLRDQCAEKRDQYAEKRDPCADCQFDTPYGPMSAAIFGAEIKKMTQSYRNSGNSGRFGMGASGQYIPGQSGQSLQSGQSGQSGQSLQSPQSLQSGQLIATNPANGTGYYTG